MVLLAALAQPGWAQAPRWQWADAQPFTVRAVAADAAGNAYVTGSFTGTIRVGRFQLTSTSTIADLIVVKFSPQGQPEWATTLGALAPSPVVSNRTYAAGVDISVDAQNGGVAVVGGMSGLFGPNVPGISLDPTRYQGDNMLVLRLSASGQIQWAVQAGSSAGFPTRGNAIATDAQGNSYITGNGYGFALSNGPLISTGARQMFVISLNRAGSFRWNTPTFANLGASGLDIAADEVGSVYVLGSYVGPFSIGGVELARQTGSALARLNSSTGTVVWARGDQEGATSLAVEPQGGAYVAGSFSGTYQLDAASISASAAREAFLARFTAGGAVTWLKALGTITTAGVRVARADTGPVVLLKRSATVAAVLGLSNAGAISWEEQATGVESAEGLAVAPGAGPRQRRVLVGGQFAGRASFPPHTLQANGSSSYLASLLYTVPAAPPASLSATVFPNPARGRFSVLLPPLSGISASLINSQGRVMRTEADFLPGKLDDKQLDVVDLPRGLYILRVSWNGEVTTVQVQLI
ncbi:hypothetical protein B0919_00475 [Hymenobacter sp. CRA2]|nr:hypothetical protein B0919_00475 [Hymenobacter sp. CRA2]